MDRVPYRRVMPSRLHNEGDGRNHSHSRTYPHNRTQYSQAPPDENVTSGETLVLQCIIAGVLLVAVLLITLVDVPAMGGVQEGVQQALSGPITPVELVSEVRAFSQEMMGLGGFGVPDTVPAVNDVPDFMGIYSDYVAPDIPLQLPIPFIPLPQDSVDDDLTAIDELLNPQIPGPSAVPGLWD